MPAAFQHANVKECVAGSISELNETKAFIWIEPLDDCVDWRPGRRRIASGCWTKRLARSFVGGIGLIVIKSAAPLVSVSSFSHLPARSGAMALSAKRASYLAGSDRHHSTPACGPETNSAVDPPKA